MLQTPITYVNISSAPCIQQSLHIKVAYEGDYYYETGNSSEIRCACGAVYHTGSTKKDITIEICSKCHPFYTGKQKLVDTSGRVDKFNRKYGLN